MRPSKRTENQLRNIKFSRYYTKYAEGSVLTEFGDTKVICTASVQKSVPHFLKDTGQGWITAEYSMLPRATMTRNSREASRGKQNGRTMEIQRLIGRSLRAAVDLKTLGELSIVIDCDVLQADGGTRTASITGGCIALADALEHIKLKGLIKKNPLRYLVASVSVGIYQGLPILDLDYLEDSTAEIDMNVVMCERGSFIEIQGTAEGKSFDQNELNNMLKLAKQGIGDLIKQQKAALGII